MREKKIEGERGRVDPRVVGDVRQKPRSFEEEHQRHWLRLPETGLNLTPAAKKTICYRSFYIWECIWSNLTVGKLTCAAAWLSMTEAPRTPVDPCCSLGVEVELAVKIKVMNQAGI